MPNRTAVLTALLLAGLGACGDRSKHATDGDTGAAAPATVRDMSATPNVGDSTSGVANPTGRPGMAGDTVGARARDSTPGATGGSPVGGRGTPGATGAGASGGAQTRP
jgi:hypothetical protein